MKAKNASEQAKQIKVTLVKSTIGALEKQKRTVEALGLKKIRQSKVHNDTQVVRGMIFVVKHLVAVEEVDG
ncbi:MAG: 50S ribosomal protein L30 [Firmicutes bacterium]|nr:50S ribosomal protein L30 [Bacillota bacterium]